MWYYSCRASLNTSSQGVNLRVGVKVRACCDTVRDVACSCLCSLSMSVWFHSRSMSSALLIFHSLICLKRLLLKGAAACLLRIVAESSFRFFLSFRAGFHLSYAYPGHRNRWCSNVSVSSPQGGHLALSTFENFQESVEWCVR